MFISFSVASYPFPYLKKALIFFFLLGVLSCKDLKNWESRYASQIKIEIEEEKDASIPEAPKSLDSVTISRLFREKQIKAYLQLLNNEANIEIENSSFKESYSSLKIDLNPNADAVSFDLRYELKENIIYYSKVIIRYKRKPSLISPQAGGMQIQYIIQDIELHEMSNKNPVFKRFTIKAGVPLQEHIKEKKTHVTLYY